MPGPVVMVVEDEADMAQFMRYHLRRAGYDVVVVSDGLTAVNRVLQHPPALVVLDWMLPRMDGLEVCRLVKSSPLSRQIPVLMVTAMAGTAHTLEGFQHGADDYLTKPFDVRELLARVYSLLQRSHAHHS